MMTIEDKARRLAGLPTLSEVVLLSKVANPIAAGLPTPGPAPATQEEGEVEQGRVTMDAMMHTEEPSPELLAWPLGPAIPRKEPPTTLPLGLMTKAKPRARVLPLYGPIEAKLPPPRTTYLAAIPGKSPPPSPNAVMNRDGQSIPPLHAQNINTNDWPPLAPEVELPPTISPTKWRPSAKAGASDPKAHSQLMPLSKCGVVAMRPELAPPCKAPPPPLLDEHVTAPGGKSRHTHAVASKQAGAGSGKPCVGA